MITLALFLFLTSSLLIVYHHVLYPLLLRQFTRHKQLLDMQELRRRYLELQQSAELPEPGASEPKVMDVAEEPFEASEPTVEPDQPPAVEGEQESPAGPDEGPPSG